MSNTPQCACGFHVIPARAGGVAFPRSPCAGTRALTRPPSADTLPRSPCAGESRSPRSPRGGVERRRSRALPTLPPRAEESHSSAPAPGGRAQRHLPRSPRAGRGGVTSPGGGVSLALPARGSCALPRPPLAGSRSRSPREG